MATFEDGYIAGILDGEGCVSGGIDKAGTITIHVAVVMLDLLPVKMLYDKFGGTFRSDNRSCSKRLVHTWRVSNGKSVEALEFIINNCAIKHRAANPALVIAKAMHDTPSGPALPKLEKERRLNLLLELREIVGRKKLSQERVDNYLIERTNGAIQVIDENGRIFKSQSEAAKAVDRTQSAIYYSIKNGHKCAGLNWNLVL